MSAPIFDPNLRVVSDNGPGGGRIVMTDEAVQGWVAAYRTFSSEMNLIADQIAQRNKETFFGDLDSLRQLARGYDRLMHEGEDSLYQRVRQFAEAATQIADKLQADWLAIQAADAESADALAKLEFQW